MATCVSIVFPYLSIGSTLGKNSDSFYWIGFPKMAHVTWVTCLITEFLNPFSHLLYPTVCLYQTALSGDKSAFRGKPTVSYYFQNCPTVILQCWTPILNYLKPLDITLVLRNCRWIGSNADHFENYPTVYSWAVAVLFAPKLLGLTSFACFTAYGWGTHTFQKSAHGIFFRVLVLF